MVYHHRYVRRPSITDAEYRLTRFAQFRHQPCDPCKKGLAWAWENVITQSGSPSIIFIWFGFPYFRVFILPISGFQRKWLRGRFPVEGIRAKKRSAVRQIKGVGCVAVWYFLGLLVFFCLFCFLFVLFVFVCYCCETDQGLWLRSAGFVALAFLFLGLLVILLFWGCCCCCFKGVGKHNLLFGSFWLTCQKKCCVVSKESKLKEFNSCA